MQYAYLHGFASGPLTKKGQRLREALDVPLRLPDLNAPSFAELSQQAMLDRLDALDAEVGDDDGWALIGSSLGGWLTARWSELRPGRVARALLLCPAFDIAGRWPSILPDGAMERWREGDLVLPDGSGTPTRLHYRFYEESTEQPAFPVIACPTRIVHGTRDQSVPVDSSRRYAAAHDHVALIEVDDGHDLLASMDVIEREARALTRGSGGSP